MDAFADRAGFVLRLAGFAAHAGSPSQYARAIAATWLIGIGAVLGLGGRAVDLDPVAMRPLDVLGAGKAAVDEMASRKMAPPRAQPFQHGPHQAPVGAAIANLDRDHDLLAGCARHLHVIARTEAAIGHLHDTRLRIGGGGARLFLRLAVAALLLALLALLLD